MWVLPLGDCLEYRVITLDNWWGRGAILDTKLCLMDNTLSHTWTKKNVYPQFQAEFSNLSKKQPESTLALLPVMKTYAFGANTWVELVIILTTLISLSLSVLPRLMYSMFSPSIVQWKKVLFLMTLEIKLFFSTRQRWEQQLVGCNVTLYVIFTGFCHIQTALKFENNYVRKTKK